MKVRLSSIGDRYGLGNFSKETGPGTLLWVALDPDHLQKTTENNQVSNHRVFSVGVLPSREARSPGEVLGAAWVLGVAERGPCRRRQDMFPQVCLSCRSALGSQPASDFQGLSRVSPLAWTRWPHDPVASFPRPPSGGGWSTCQEGYQGWAYSHRAFT